MHVRKAASRAPVAAKVAPHAFSAVLFIAICAPQTHAPSVWSAELQPVEALHAAYWEEQLAFWQVLQAVDATAHEPPPLELVLVEPLELVLVLVEPLELELAPPPVPPLELEVDAVPELLDVDVAPELLDVEVAPELLAVDVLVDVCPPEPVPVVVELLLPHAARSAVVAMPEMRKKNVRFMGSPLRCVRRSCRAYARLALGVHLVREPRPFHRRGRGRIELSRRAPSSTPATAG